MAGVEQLELLFEVAFDGDADLDSFGFLLGNILVALAVFQLAVTNRGGEHEGACGVGLSVDAIAFVLG